MRSNWITSLALCAALAGPAAAEEPRLFEGDSVLVITLEAPFTTLFKELRETGEEVDATLTVTTATGVESHEVKLATRGKTRRDKKTCKFPPLQVNFKKKDAKHTIFHKQDKLKLVTHCQTGRKNYETYYRQEFLIYKTYNLLTEESFRVRQASIDYVDTAGKQSAEGKFAFFIEDADRLAKRLGRERRDIERVSSSEYEAAAAGRVALFQYFIGNLDWAILGGPEGEKCCHNSKPFFAANGMAIPVPYDFDYAGLINARYAVPPSAVPVKSVRTRYYRGFCAHNEGLDKAVSDFQTHKEEIYALMEGSELLPERTTKSARKYYDDFFALLASPEMVDRKLAQKCR